MGKLFVLLGVCFVVIGLVVMNADHLGFLKHLGRLPGDIHVKRENFNLYIPLTTSLLVSALISLVFWLFRR